MHHTLTELDQNAFGEGGRTIRREGLIMALAHRPAIRTSLFVLLMAGSA